MLTIYHNHHCSKSRLGCQYLLDREPILKIVNYVTNPLTKKELEHLLSLLGMKPMELMRTNEDFYKQEIKGKKFTDDELIDFMVANQNLIQRPIVVNGDKAVVARPVEKIDSIL